MSDLAHLALTKADWLTIHNYSAGDAGGRRRHLGDGVPLPEREVSSLPSPFVLPEPRSG